MSNITLALSNSGYTVPLAVIVFFALPIAFTLFFGRTFCAGVCPLGAIQDVVSVRPGRVPSWLEDGLGLLPYLYLGGAILFAATGSAFIICEYDPFVAFFRLSGTLNMFVLGAAFFLVGLVVERPYCRFFCPYGALLNLVSRASKWHVTITPSECIQCHLCADACPLGVIRKPGVQAGSGAPQRGVAKKRLALYLALLPVLVGLSVWLGVRLGPVLSRVNPSISLAEQIWLEDAGEIQEISEASEAFRGTGRSTAELYEEGRNIKRQFAVGGGALGAFIGLVFGFKLIFLSAGRPGVDYEINRGGCVSCGRCFDYCPVGKETLDGQLLKIEGAGIYGQP